MNSFNGSQPANLPATSSPQLQAEAERWRRFKRWIEEREAWLKSPWAPFDHELEKILQAFPDGLQALEQALEEPRRRLEIGRLTSEEKAAVDEAKKAILRRCTRVERCQVGLEIDWYRIETWYVDATDLMASVRDMRSELVPADFPDPPVSRPQTEHAAHQPGPSHWLSTLARHIGYGWNLQGWRELPEERLPAASKLMDAKWAAAFAASIASSFEDPWRERRLALEGTWPQGVGLELMYPGEAPDGWERLISTDDAEHE